MRDRAIFVEIAIRAGMEDLWRMTQTPELHERWDLRFTEIRYLPRPDPSQPQRFLYATRIGFGLGIRGEGESVGESKGPGERASALRFRSEDPKSLIREGSGFWKYVQADGGMRFLTRYDYRTRFGLFGRVVDRLAFRPLLGWATAWSFDRLRLWLERGIDPAVSMQRSVIHAIARTSLALAWIYQGVVPKLLCAEVSGELDTIRATGLFPGNERTALHAAGAAEIAFGMMLLVLWRSRLLFLVNAAALLLLAGAGIAADPGLFGQQFDPVSLSLAMIALGVVGGLAARDLPTASRCLRREKERAR